MDDSIFQDWFAGDEYNLTGYTYLYIYRFPETNVKVDPKRKSRSFLPLLFHPGLRTGNFIGIQKIVSATCRNQVVFAGQMSTTQMDSLGEVFHDSFKGLMDLAVSVGVKFIISAGETANVCNFRYET